MFEKDQDIYRAYRETFINKVSVLRNEGLYIQEIAEKLGISRATFYRRMTSFRTSEITTSDKTENTLLADELSNIGLAAASREAVSSSTGNYLMGGNGAASVVFDSISDGKTIELSMTETDRLTTEVKRVSVGEKGEQLIFASKKSYEIFELIEAYKDNMDTVLIKGPTGVGKELIAKGLHYLSVRKNSPFVAVNCAEIPRDLWESIFNGHAKGAFTGASLEAKMGIYQNVRDGTLFLDEISEIPLDIQAKLLRFLDDRIIRPVGNGSANNLPRFEGRVIMATNRNLSDLSLRKDIFYRSTLGGYFDVPPLSERIEDIIPIAEYFLASYNNGNGSRKYILNESAKEELLSYNYPGNARELRGILNRARLQADLINKRNGNNDIIIIDSEQIKVLPNTK